MEALARFVVSAAELMEAEGRMLKKQLIRFGLLLVMGLVALLAVITGVAFVIAGIFRALADYIGAAWALMAIGCIWLILAAVAARFSGKLLR